MFLSSHDLYFQLISTKERNFNQISVCRNEIISFHFNHLSANPTKWSNTLKQFVGNSSSNGPLGIKKVVMQYKRNKVKVNRN